MFLSLCGEDVWLACMLKIDVMPNNKLSPDPDRSYSKCRSKDQSFFLQSHHPLTQFFNLFPDEREAMDSAMQILATIAIVLSESNHENPEEVRLNMQGFRNLFNSFQKYHNTRF